MSLFDVDEPLYVPSVTSGGMRAPSAPTWLKLPFTLQEQLGINWCWAAVSQGVAEFYGIGSWTQCEIASRTLPGSRNCCTATPRGGPCDETYYLHEALTTVGHLGGPPTGPLSATEIQAQLQQNRPIGVRIRWQSGRGHFIVLTGYLDGRRSYVEVHDSASDSRDPTELSLTHLMTRYAGLGIWSHSFVTM